MTAPVVYTVQTAAAATGLSRDRIKAAINGGQLPAKVSGGFQEGTGKPLGKYLIRPADLMAWIDGLEDA